MRLIVNADDLGYDPEVTRGILEAMDRGIVTSATLMVNTPHSAGAADAVKGTGKAIGLHFNLARWKPLSPAFTLPELDEAKVPRLAEAVVTAELEAQLRRFEALVGAPATHVDVHKHLHRFPAVLGGMIRVARDHGLPVRAIDPPMRASLRGAGVRTTDAFIGDAGAEPYWTVDRLREALGALGEGITELMCHPGYAPRQVKSGYAAQRETELRTFNSGDARSLVEQHRISLETFRNV